MRRMFGYQWLLIAAAVMPMAGCSGASSPDFADTVDPIDEPVALKLPAEGKTTADLDVVPERSKTAPLIEPVEDEDVRIADSDTPASGDQSPGEKATDEASAASQSPQPKERADRDDPKARTIISPVAEKQDDASLDNGRAPAARPLPEGKRVAVKSKDVASEPLSDGRGEGAQPGQGVSDPKKSNPTTKPAPPTPATLADVSDSLRALDKDGDGQVGLYEWPREQLARFKTLDSNEDGFLTPAELVADEKSVAPLSKAAPSKAAPSKAAPPKTTPPKAAPKETDKKAKQDDPQQDPIEAEVTNSAKDDTPESEPKQDGGETSPAKAATKIDEAGKTPESKTSDQADAPDDKAAEEDDVPNEDKPTQGS